MTSCGGVQVRSTRAEQVRDWKCHVLAQIDVDDGNLDERHGDVMAGQHAFRVWPLELDRELWPEHRACSERHSFGIQNCCRIKVGVLI
jgi:hypothetical protein